jgi:hypothetical protein
MFASTPSHLPRCSLSVKSLAQNSHVWAPLRRRDFALPYMRLIFCTVQHIEKKLFSLLYIEGDYSALVGVIIGPLPPQPTFFMA